MSRLRVIRSVGLTVGCGLYTLWGALTGNVWIWAWAALATGCAALALRRDHTAHLAEKDHTEGDQS